jgi:ketosteroid isomerase-like protein
MPRRPIGSIPPATLHASADDVETQFYEALQQGDLDKLMGLWADDDEIACMHPGGGRVIGMAAIRASFEAIFAGGGIPMRPEQVHRMQHMGCAIHHLVERIEVRSSEGTQQAWVLATNVFVKTALGWKLAAHHASAAAAQEPPMMGGEAPTTLH